MYQTLDACDGKHARNTKASSALGQLFDHGCDSLGTVLTTLPVAVTCGLGCSVWTIAVLFAVQTPFFLAQWEEYHTHVMRTCTGYIGVTEGQLLSMGVILVASILGSDFWSTPVNKFLPYPITSLLNALTITTLARIAVAGVLISNSWLSYNNIKSVVTLKQKQNKEEGQNCFLQLIPLATLIVCGILYQETKAFRQYPVIAFATLGFVFSHLTTQMIVKSLTHEHFPVLQWAIVPLPFILLNSFAKKPPLREDLVLVIYFLFVLFCVARYIYGVIDQLTKALNIYCLKLGKRDDKQS
jgi:phosphatidylglycerophosphate synthase